MASARRIIQPYEGVVDEIFDERDFSKYCIHDILVSITKYGVADRELNFAILILLDNSSSKSIEFDPIVPTERLI